MATLSVKTTLPAKASRVWKVVGDFNALPTFLEAVVNSEQQGEGIGALRLLTLPDGKVVRERLKAYDDKGMTLQYTIVDGPLPVQNYLSTMRVTPLTEGCEFTWSCEFLPKGASEQGAKDTLEGIYRNGFKGLAKLFSTN